MCGAQFGKIGQIGLKPALAHAQPSDDQVDRASVFGSVDSKFDSDSRLTNDLKNWYSVSLLDFKGQRGASRKVCLLCHWKRQLTRLANIVVEYRWLAATRRARRVAFS